MKIGRLIGLILVAGAICTFIFYSWAINQESAIDRATVGFYVMCSLPPLGGLAGGIACLVEKTR